MKRTNILLAAILAAGASVPVVADAQASGPASDASTKVAKVQLRHTEVGKVLVDAAGFTLYRFTKDPRNKNTCVKISGCASIWPALKTSGKPIAGPGVKASLLSTITLPNGSKQVTYAGHPLYLYAPSSEPAETSYVGFSAFGGVWDAVNAAGNPVK